jgi:REP-associated tyrosine transposase
MARSPRIEIKGGLYHVTCHGDREEPIFVDDDDREIFIATLGQTCKRAGIVIHAFALMNNHYHLLLETPAGNLVAGMRWFQTTYTARFNSRHRLGGHLFQGRYKALLIDPNVPEYSRTVADYVHLNPVRAGLVQSEEELAIFPWCSYRFYASAKGLPEWLRIATIYQGHGLTCERGADQQRFRQYMAERIDRELEEKRRPIEAQKDVSWSMIRQGWVLGTEAFRDRIEVLVRARIAKGKRESYSGSDLRRHDQKQAVGLLGKALERLQLDIDQMRAMKKNDLRKQATAWLLKSRTTVGNQWICETLKMGDRSNVNRAMHQLELVQNRQIKRIRNLLSQCPD